MYYVALSRASRRLSGRFAAEVVEAGAVIRTQQLGSPNLPAFDSPEALRQGIAAPLVFRAGSSIMYCARTPACLYGHTHQPLS
jgi:hypothetical protein